MRGRNLLDRGLGLLALALLLVASTACERRAAEVPANLIGHWTTDATEYQDRFLEILKTAVRFGTGEGGVASHPVVEVSWENVEFGVAYTIVYEDSEGGEHQLHLLYDPSVHILRLKNRPQAIWQRHRAARLDKPHAPDQSAGSSHAG